MISELLDGLVRATFGIDTADPSAEAADALKEVTTAEAATEAELTALSATMYRRKTALDEVEFDLVEASFQAERFGDPTPYDELRRRRGDLVSLIERGQTALTALQEKQ